MRLIPLFSGSSGNCIIIEGGGARLLLDAGLPGRSIENAMAQAGVAPETLEGILVTHEHSDHVRGVGVLSRRYKLPVYANAGTWAGMAAEVGRIAAEHKRLIETGGAFYVRALRVTSLPIPHDANEPVAFRFDAEGRSCAVLTDLGYMREELYDALAGCELLLIESNHDEDMLKAGPYPYPLKRRILGDLGHLSNANCGKALAKLYARGLRAAVLGHLSGENNYEALAQMTVRAELRAQDVPDAAFPLSVAHRDRITGVFEL